MKQFVKELPKEEFLKYNCDKFVDLSEFLFFIICKGVELVHFKDKTDERKLMTDGTQMEKKRHILY